MDNLVDPRPPPKPPGCDDALTVTVEVWVEMAIDEPQFDSHCKSEQKENRGITFYKWGQNFILIGQA